MVKIPFEAFIRGCAPETLGSGSIFGAISTEATTFLLRNGDIHQVSEGDTVYRYGEKGSSFFVVCSGQLAFHKRCGSHSVVTRTVGFGEEIGFAAMIALVDHAGHAVAIEDSVLLEISAALFGELYQHYPQDFGLMLMNLARDLARNVRRLSDMIVELNIGKSAVGAFCD